MSSPAFGSPAYNNESIGWQLIMTGLVSISIAFVLVIARLYTKFFLTKSPGWEDCHSVIALLLAIGRVVGDSFGVYQYSLGRHFSVFPKSHMGPLIALLVADGLLYVVSITFAKLAILIFLYRIFKVVPKFRNTSWAIGAFMTVWALVTVLLVCFSCKPLAGAFNFKVRMLPTTVCRISASRVEKIFGFCNIIVDFILLFLPMPLLWKLQMTRAKKIGVSIVFANGAVICAIAIVRQYILYSATDGTDPAWDIIKVKVWMTIEVNLAIICGCLPVLQPLFRNSLLLIPYLPSRIRSKLSGSHSAMEQASPSRRLTGSGSVNARDVEHGRKTPWRQPDELSESGDRLAPGSVGTEGGWSEPKGVAL